MENNIYILKSLKFVDLRKNPILCSTICDNFNSIDYFKVYILLEKIESDKKYCLWLPKIHKTFDINYVRNFIFDSIKKEEQLGEKIEYEEKELEKMIAKEFVKLMYDK